MKIILLSASYAPVIGGLQTVVHSLARELIARGHQVRVVANRYPVKLPQQETIEGVSINRLLFLKPSLNQLQQGRLDLFAASLYFAPQSKRQLARIVKEFQPDVINVHFPNLDTQLLLKLQEQFGFRLVVSLHGHDVYQFTRQNGAKNGTKKAQLRAMLRCADAVTAVSEDLMCNANKIEPAVSHKTSVIPNGVHTDRFARAIPYKHSRPYVLGLGRLVRAKGFDLLIDAFAKCQLNEKPDLIIVGDGEEGEALRQQVLTLELSNRVHFRFGVSAEEAAALIKGSAAVVVPSRAESFGLVALEALAGEKPLVATNVGGLPELISIFIGKDGHVRGNGLHARVAVVNPTSDGIAAGLEQVFAELPVGAQTTYEFPERFKWESVATAYERVLIGE